MNFFEENNIRLLKWAPQSPDLNPIEHIWAFIKTQLRKYNIKNKDELKEKILEIWESIPLNMVQKYIGNMPKRFNDIFNANGGHSKY